MADSPDAIITLLCVESILLIVVSSHASKFWSETARYHDLARDYERNIEITHPPFVTSDGAGHRVLYHDVWSATSVTYYEYRGDSLK